MTEASQAAGLLPMTPRRDLVERGKEIRRRRLALGISSVHELVRATERLGMKVSRDAATAAEKGTASEDTYDRIEAFFDKFAEVTGDDAGDAGLVTFRLSGNFGVEVTVQGPIQNIAELEAAVERLIRAQGEGGTSQ